MIIHETRTLSISTDSRQNSPVIEHSTRRPPPGPPLNCAGNQQLLQVRISCRGLGGLGCDVESPWARVVLRDLCGTASHYSPHILDHGATRTEVAEREPIFPSSASELSPKRARRR